MATAQFNDGLPGTYHALYPDWRSPGRSEAEAAATPGAGTPDREAALGMLRAGRAVLALTG